MVTTQAIQPQDVVSSRRQPANNLISSPSDRYLTHGWDQVKVWTLKGKNSHSNCISKPFLLLSERYLKVWPSSEKSHPCLRYLPSCCQASDIPYHNSESVIQKTKNKKIPNNAQQMSHFRSKTVMQKTPATCKGFDPLSDSVVWSDQLLREVATEEDWTWHHHLTVSHVW